jgi:hypothetical protein
MSKIKNVEWDKTSNKYSKKVQRDYIVLHTEGKTIQVILETQMLLKFSTNSGGHNVLVHVSLSMPPCPWTRTRTGTHRRGRGHGQIMMLKFSTNNGGQKISTCPCVPVYVRVHGHGQISPVKYIRGFII